MLVQLRRTPHGPSGLGLDKCSHEAEVESKAITTF